MTTVTYTCDKCGKVETDPSCLWSILLIIINRPGHTRVDSFQNIKNRADWCRSCVEKANMLPIQEIKKEEVVPLTIEDIIRDIVREELPHE